jgi:phosphoglycerate dehydrogenase-like enzyme
MMKAILQYRASPGFVRQLEAAAPEWLSVEVIDEADRERFARAIGSAEVLLHVLEPVTGEVIARARQLRLIQKIGVGVNTIDLAAARARGIAVANMPGTNSQAVAEMSLALMLAALRRIPFLDRMTRAGQGGSVPAHTYDRIGEIAGRTVGLVGYGEVPRRLAPVLQALGARVIYTSPRPKPDAAGQWHPLAELLRLADIVSLHLPLTPQSTRIINAQSIGQMKPGAVLINTARGGLVDEPALLAALQDGRIAAAGLDVLDEEPARIDNPLLGLDNVVLSPHVSWLTPETLGRSIGIAIENCRRLACGEPLLHQIAP